MELDTHPEQSVGQTHGSPTVKLSWGCNCSEGRKEEQWVWMQGVWGVEGEVKGKEGGGGWEWRWRWGRKNHHRGSSSWCLSPGSCYINLSFMRRLNEEEEGVNKESEDDEDGGGGEGEGAHLVVCREAGHGEGPPMPIHWVIGLSVGVPVPPHLPHLYRL